MYAENANLTLDYSDRTNRFHFSCPPWMNDLARAIPNRRWSNKEKVWTAPALRANARYFQDLRGVKITEAALEKIKECQAAAHRVKNMFPPWYQFKTKPRPYQLKALNKTYGNKVGGFIMGMGTGKTKTYIDLACAMRIENLIDRTLVVCPMSIRNEWKGQLELHASVPVDAHFLDTSKEWDFDRWLDRKHDYKWLVVAVESLSVGKAARLCEQFLLGSTKCSMVIDESTKIKNHESKRNEACMLLATRAEYRHILTGTPLANGPMDYYAQFEFLDTQIIGVGDYYSFRNLYAVMGGYEGKQIVGYTKLEELAAIIEPFIYEVSKEEALPDLPPKTYQQRFVQLTAEQKELYTRVRKLPLVKTPQGEIELQNVMVRTLRLSELTSGFYTEAVSEDGGEPEFVKQWFPKSPKLVELLDVLEEAGDKPTIIWTRFKPELKLIKDALRERYGNDKFVEYSGDVSEDDRAINKQRYLSGDAQFFVATPQSGGMGLNLQVTELEVFMSNSYNYLERVQAEDRGHRMGTTKPVLIVDILAEGTVNEHELKALQNKHGVSEYMRELIRSKRVSEVL